MEAGGRSRSGRQSEKQRAKEEERAKRAREKEMKRQEKKNGTCCSDTSHYHRMVWPIHKSYS